MIGALATTGFTCAAAPVRALPASADDTATATIGGLPDEAALDAFIEAKRRDAGWVGLGAAIVVDGRVAWTRGYGFSDRDAEKPFTPDTVMNIGSISKTFTGVALMQAVEVGKLSLDEDVGRYLPFPVRNPRFPGDKITLRQLATHTSGIVDREAVYDTAYHQGGDSPVPLGDFLHDVFAPGGRHVSPENFLDARPGSNREYSNIGAALAGYAVERATGLSLPELGKRRIFQPLKMTRTAWSLRDVDLAQHARLYEPEESAGKEASTQEVHVRQIPLYGITTYPDGGVRTSVADLSRFFLALLTGGEFEGGRILEPASVAEMLRFHYTPENKPENVVLAEKNSGIFWSTKLDVTFIGHGGSDPGLKTEMLADLDGKVGMILFTNTGVDDRNMRAYYDVAFELMKRGRALRVR